MGKAISRIERLAYTAENLAAAKASGRPYDADTNYIYLVRASEVVYTISALITGDYTASDHGQEIIEGGTVEVFVQTLYGQNLVDKLRTDVVTKSQDLVNNLTSTATNKALTAAQGKALKDITDTLNSKITGEWHDFTTPASPGITINNSVLETSGYIIRGGICFVSISITLAGIQGDSSLPVVSGLPTSLKNTIMPPPWAVFGAGGQTQNAIAESIFQNGIIYIRNAGFATKWQLSFSYPVATP